jgi:hypothetical protein
MNKSITLLGLILFLLSTSCATIVSTSHYPVSIKSSPEESDITIIDRNGQEVFSGRTPTLVELDASAGFFKPANYVIKFKKEGYQNTTAFINSTLDGWYWGNFIFAGLIGFLIVDPATGAMFQIKQNYVDQVLYPVDQ